MRSGVLASALCHLGLVSLVMLSSPRQFVASERSVEVELVRADEIEPAREQPKPDKPEPEKPNVWDFPPDRPLIQLPDFSADPQRKAPATPPAQAKSAPAKSAQAKSAPSAQAKNAPPPAEANSAPPAQQSQPAPSNSQQAALSPAPPPQSSIAQQAPSAPAPPKGAPSVFDPASIPMLMDLPNQQSGAADKGFDFEATVTANVSSDERAAFKAHLRKCWKLPEGVSPAARAVLRVYLRRDGSLASEPVVIEVSGVTRGGAEVLEAAKNALRGCAPYAFLPAEKYREWRILDLTFTPGEMAGG